MKKDKKVIENKRKCCNKKIVSKITRFKISQKLKGRKLSKVTKRKISNTLKGRKRLPFSEKWKNNIRKSKIGKMIGKDNPMYGKRGKKAPFYGKNHTEESKQKMRRATINHHIYLKENSNKTLKLTTKKHRQLHNRAYDYIYYKFGRKGIDNYIKWFDKKFKLISKRKKTL